MDDVTFALRPEAVAVVVSALLVAGCAVVFAAVLLALRRWRRPKDREDPPGDDAA